MSLSKQMKLGIAGLGIILYSKFAVAHIAEGEDYFSSCYQTPEQVANHIKDGTIVGFCTSSSGQFIFEFRDGYPNEEDLSMFEFKIRLAIKVEGGKVYFRDLYELMDWTNKCPESQILEMKDGVYHITLCTNVPASGVLGDDQIIYIYLNKLDAMPTLTYDGVPILCE